MDLTIATFVAFLALFTGVGIYAATRKRATPEDYLLASRSVHPWMVALSAVSTNNSGFMFVGLTGSAYASGVSAAVWLMGGWIVGDVVAWMFVHRRLRAHSSTVNTIPGFLGAGMKNGRVVVAVAAVITFAFLGVYAAAQLTAGRKALAVFGIDDWIGIVLGAGMVAIYCFSGGIRASIWTDVVQSIVMLISMVMLVTVALIEAGGPAQMWATLEAADPSLTAWIPGDLRFGFVMFALGWFAAGFGVVGQPHIMVRFMAIDSVDSLTRARNVYLLWYVMFTIACILTGLCARALIPLGSGFDTELAFPTLSSQLLPGVLVGVMLAGLFAATISTADSQVLACSAAITQDLVPAWRRSYLAVKAATLAITLAAMVIALLVTWYPSLQDSVFLLVIFAWSGLASAFGPLLVVRALGWPVDTPTALAMIIGGLACVLVWRFALELSGAIYGAFPGMLAGIAVYALAYAGWLRAPRA